MPPMLLLLRQTGQTLALPDEAPPATMGGGVISRDLVQFRWRTTAEIYRVQT